MAQIEKGLEYLKSRPSHLKMVELVVLLITIGCVAYFMDKYPYSDYEKKGNLEFLMFVAVVGWFLAMAFFFLFVTGIHEGMTAVNWPLSVAIISALWAVLLLISSSLVADFVRYYKERDASYSKCEQFDILQTDYRCGQLIGGAVYGFIAMLLFAIDTSIHFSMYSDARQASARRVSL